MSIYMDEDELQRVATLLQVTLTPAVRDVLQAIRLVGYNEGSKETSRQWMDVIDKQRRSA